MRRLEDDVWSDLPEFIFERVDAGRIVVEEGEGREQVGAAEAKEAARGVVCLLYTSDAADE